jgi:polyisoprenoid-binding protein YceI
MTATATTTTIWAIDQAHSLIEFSAKHMMFTTVKGRFTGFSGTITEHTQDQSLSSVNVTIDTASVTTGDAKRDGHLGSTDFLNAEQYPQATFVSKRVEALGGDRYRVIGDLTLAGVTRELGLDAELQGQGVNPYGKTVAGVSATTAIKRSDFGLNWNVALEAGGVLVSDQVKFALEIQAVKQD